MVVNVKNTSRIVIKFLQDSVAHKPC